MSYSDIIKEIKEFVRKHGEIELNAPTEFTCKICNRKYRLYRGTVKSDTITHYDKCITDGKIGHESEFSYELHHIDILTEILEKIRLQFL